MKKIELPVGEDNTSPTNPDLHWMGKMIAILAGFIIFGYIIFMIFAHVVIANISIETEKNTFEASLFQMTE